MYNDLIDKLVPIAAKLLASAGPNGVTVSELREAAQKQLPQLNAFGHQALSSLGQVFRKAGGKSTGIKRCSTIPQSKGIRQTVWAMK